MKRKNRIKLALDIVMLVVLLLMYRKNVLGLTFHEIGGMAGCGLFIIHILLNGKWVLAMSGKLFSPKIAWRSKLNWLLDFLLLLCFAYILVSGIFISKVLFTVHMESSSFKVGHYAVSALALALIGIHIGLHYHSIITRTPARRLPLVLRRVTAIVMSVLILGFGVYQMTATSFFHWMSSLGSVITASSAFPEAKTAALPAGDSMFTGAAGGGDADTAANEAISPDIAISAALTAPVKGNGSGGGGGNGNGGGRGKGANQAADPSQLGPLLLNFASITLAFAVVTAWVDAALLKRKQKKLLRCDIPEAK